uniref:NADH-ubiquinone oxidoreductase chain 2 n=1 Tax=Myanophis thanlyinensis TaxID=2777982 RepID=A0A8B0R8I6_9SAUR|nr:NADH dehydrogenase subunit 2 [Myanophis thanlyinensis]QTW91651.1 NADH dehydrogenase subunit 2 [Myanophis thanlyinensis]
MNLLSWLVISTSILLSTLLITTATHWLMVWACLEINTISMIPIIAKSHHPRSAEASTKYFLTQTLASTTMLFAATTNAMNTSNWEINLTTEPMTMTIITAALLMKMAAAPFHFWLPEVSQGATTMTTLILLTWQKIAPLTILVITHNETNMTLLLMSATLSITVGGLGAVNQTQLRKLLAYSSITHTGWTIAILTMAPKISMLTYMTYLITTTPIMLIMNLTSSSSIKDMGNMWTSSPHLMLAASTSILSLGGLPPLTGFMPKWLILNKMTAMNMTIEATTMAVLSLISLFVYMRLMYLTSMTTPPHTTLMSMKWRLPNKNHLMLTSLTTVCTTTLLPMSPNI